MAGPVMRFRSGSVSATVWENRGKDGILFPTVKLTKLERDKETQEWKETSVFAVNDLPVVAILARKAFEALALDHAASGLAAPVEEEPEAEVAKPSRKPRSSRKAPL